MQRALPPSIAAAILLVGVAGCFTDDEGRQPDATRLYYPTGLVVSPGKSTLYVANSDFDLGFSGGSVQALNLATLRATVSPLARALAEGQSGPAACASVGLGPNGQTFLNPGPCTAFDVVPFIGGSAFIGAFASGLALVHNPDGTGARLFSPVRGDPSITFFDVHDDRTADSAPTFQLACQQGPDGFCGAAHRLGQDRDRTLRGIQLPADPVGIAATADGTALVSAHQTQGAASLTLNPWNGAPELAYFTSNLAAGPTELVSLPRPAFVAPATADASAAGRSFSYDEGFVLTFRSTAQLDVLRYVSDAGSAPPRPFLVRSASLGVLSNDAGFDSRGVAVRDRDRKSCEGSCGTDLDCLVSCAEQVPLELFVANRTPETLLIGEVRTIVNRQDGEDGRSYATSASEELLLYDTVPLSFGPSRVELGQVLDENGELSDRIFAVCFDSRSVFIYDPEARRTETVIHTGRGPHDIAIDVGTHPDGEPYAYLYVGHFTDSYLGVVDLDMRHGVLYGQMFASIGTPTPPQESK